ncbi:hypothetical protein [Acetobacter persici]|uniref:hypothetical protein n=1 Tax=Acetobacter persici TaxID=1076596 RepID=UPI0039EA6A24
MSRPKLVMTEAEEDNLIGFRCPRLLFHRAEQMALALLDLTNPDNDISFPQARHSLADELCMALGRLGEVTGYGVKGGQS